MSESESTTGRIVIDLFTTLDGVAQAPGGPEEDPSEGFQFGGWQAPFDDAFVGESVLTGILQLDALLLGRRTYDIFAGYWPRFAESSIGGVFDAVPKYVASRDPGLSLGWNGSIRVGADLATDVQALRTRHREVHVIGSVNLVQTLLREQLFDELRLWVYPVVLGEGHKVFPDGCSPANLRLVGKPHAGPSGAVQLIYEPLPGRPETGTMEPWGPSEQLSVIRAHAGGAA